MDHKDNIEFVKITDYREQLLRYSDAVLFFSNKPWLTFTQQISQ